MLIVGAGGLAKEVLEIFHQNQDIEGICFYDDITYPRQDKLYRQFPILHEESELNALFKTDNRFIIAVGRPDIRQSLFERFLELGAVPVSAISPQASIGHYEVEIGLGTIIMAGTVITNSVRIGKAVLINPNCSISHDSEIGDFSELSPGVCITGKCTIAEKVNLGTGANILPGIHIASGATVGAGAVVTKSVEAGITLAGVPAKPLNL